MLQLTRITRQGDLRKYAFEEYSRPGYCSRAATLYVTPEFQIEAIRLNSSHFGVVTWSRARGITESTAWHDATPGHQQPGHGVYYAASGTRSQAGIAPDVMADVLASAPDDGFRSLVRSFVADTNGTLTYPVQNYSLSPAQTTGQIHVLRYAPKETNSHKIELTWHSVRYALHRYLHPLAMARGVSSEVRDSLDRVQYECQNCGATNALLTGNCAACGSPRPRLPVTVVLRYLLRASVDMSYALYVALCLSFLVITMFRALSLMPATN